MKKYLPLVAVEAYLIFTLLLYSFGPIKFAGHNPLLFWGFICAYHLAFVLGYFVATKTCDYRQENASRRCSSIFFYLTFFFGTFSVLLTYQNLMLADSIIPYNFFADVIRGTESPAQVYLHRMNSISDGVNSGTRILNIASLFFAFFKLFFIFLFMYFWKHLSFFQKMLSLVYCCLFVSSGLASGTNSVIFIFFIFASLNFLVSLYLKSAKKLLMILPFILSALLIPAGYFGYIMSKRGGGVDYFAGTSPLGDITISMVSGNVDSFSNFFSYTFLWLTYYLVQGYYGFSLILDLDFKWTFGFGNSDFLQRQLLLLTDIDISNDTFQARVSEYWSSAQWHSFYGQFANDFGLIGVTALMFLLGYFFSRVWASVIYKNSLYGASLLPIFALIFIFLPANNQVFGYIDTLSYIVFMSVFWFFEDKRVIF